MTHADLVLVAKAFKAAQKATLKLKDHREQIVGLSALATAAIVLSSKLAAAYPAFRPRRFLIACGC